MSLEKERLKVVVTGGAGFIGSHTALALLRRGDEVVVIDEMNDFYDPRIKEENLKLLEEFNSASESSKPFTFYKANISDESAKDAIFSKEKPDSIYHFSSRLCI